MILQANLPQFQHYVNILIETTFQRVLVEKDLFFGLKFTKGKQKIGICSEGHS